MTNQSCKIAIACQQGLVRALLRNIVTAAAGVEIAGEACTVSELLELLKNSVVDLLLLDIDLLKEHGKRTVALIKDILPQIKILAVHKSKPHIAKSISNSVDGCFSMEQAPEELQAAIQAVGRK